MALEIRDELGQQALDAIQTIERHNGNAVIEGFDFEVTGDREVTIGPGRAIVEGEVVETSEQVFTFDQPDTFPRKDLIVVDSTATVKVREGEEEERLPSDDEKFFLQRPAPQDLADVEETPLWEVFVDESAAALEDPEDLRDRRLDAKTVVSSLELLEAPEQTTDAVPKIYSDAHYSLHESRTLLGPEESIIIDEFEIPEGFKVQVSGANVASEKGYVELELFNVDQGTTELVVDNAEINPEETLYIGSEGDRVVFRAVNISGQDSDDFSAKISYKLIRA